MRPNKHQSTERLFNTALRIWTTYYHKITRFDESLPQAKNATNGVVEVHADYLEESTEFAERAWFDAEELYRLYRVPKSISVEAKEEALERSNRLDRSIWPIEV